MEVEASRSPSVNQILLEWVQLIKSDKKFYIVKAMDLFSMLPESNQKALIDFIADKVGMESWKTESEDSTKYSDVIRNILFYFTGKEKLQQPNKTEFAGHLRDYFNVIKDEKKTLVRIEKERKFKERVESL